MEISVEKGSSLHQNVSQIVKLPSIDDFTITKPISRGAFGKVFLGIKNDKPDQMYAVKVMKKSELVNKNMINQVLAERDALAVSRSPFVVQLFYSMQSKNNIFLVMEYMIGGDLKSLLHVYGLFDESMAIFYTAEAVQALEYLHHHNIVHRDLKPDNMLISADGHMKLTDFGLSRITIKKPIQLTDLLGTPSCFNTSSKYLKNRTPGQLLSLTSSLMFTTQRHSSPDVGDMGSPILPRVRSIGAVSNIKPSSFANASDGLKHQEHPDRIASSGSFTSSNHLRFDSPLKDEENDSVKKSLEVSRKLDCSPPMKRGRSFASSSSNSSSSSNATPFQPKQKRKILQSRSTKNFREMKSSSHALQCNSSPVSESTSSQMPLKAPRLQKSVNRKKNHSTSSSDDAKFLCQSKTSSGLTSIISDMRLRRSVNCQKSPLRSKEYCISSPSDSDADNVFYSASSFNNNSYSEMGPPKLPPKTRIQSFSSDSDCELSYPKRFQSSFVEDSENLMKSAKNVNFCLKPPNPANPSGSFNSHSPIPPPFPVSSKAAKCFENAFLNDASLNSFAYTPGRDLQRNVRAHSTPVSIANTPYKTPKSVRRGPEPDSDTRILGTPDYLAPELLLHKEHSFPVDWWALGVCLFEFLTGIPPFNDISPEAVFTNILHRDIPWPPGDEALSENTQNVIDLLLTFEAPDRPGAKELKTWPLFKDFEWENLLQMKAPFIPVPDSPSDTTYFEARNSIQHLEVSNIDM